MYNNFNYSTVHNNSQRKTFCGFSAEQSFLTFLQTNMSSVDIVNINVNVK